MTASKTVYVWAAVSSQAGRGRTPAVSPIKCLSFNGTLYGRPSFPDGRQMGISDLLTWPTLCKAFHGLAITCQCDFTAAMETAAADGIDLDSEQAAESEYLRRQINEGEG